MPDITKLHDGGWNDNNLSSDVFSSLDLPKLKESDKGWNDTNLLGNIFGAIFSSMGVFAMFALLILEIFKVAIGLFTIALAFSVVLAIGIFMRRPGCVAAYLIYGSNIVLMAMVIHIAILATNELEMLESKYDVFMCLFLSSLFYLIYISVLRMIYVTYKKMTAETDVETMVLLGS